MDDATNAKVEEAYPHLAPPPELREEVLSGLDGARLARRRVRPRRRLIGAAAAVLVTAAILASVVPRPEPAATGDGAPGVTELVAANNAFAFDLLRAATSRTDGDVVLAPHSVATALVMLREGAKGPTRLGIDRVLHLPKGDPTAAWNDLVAALATEDLEIESAERVWLQDGLPAEREYERLLADRYGAPLGRVDFSDPDAARDAMNGWTAGRTMFRVKEVVAPWGLSSEVRLAATAGMRLRGRFRAPRRVGAFLYGGGAAGRLVELPYGGGDASIVFLLPSPGGVDALLDDLTGPHLAEWLESTEKRDVPIRIRPFDFTTRRDLGPTLGSMGMSAAADPDVADFGRLSAGRPLVLGPVWHETSISFDRRGTDARVPSPGAATRDVAVKDARPGARPSEPITDEGPFLFLVRHVPTGAVLLAGRVD